MSAAWESLCFRPDRAALVAPGQIEAHWCDMTATLSAQVTLAQSQAHLAQQGQWIPIDGDPSWTLGKLVELNSTGPLRLGYGAWRDLLLGCQFHNGRGELVTAGGRTVKNVAGYDLTKFMVGQAGVLGNIVTITTRTYRRPDAGLIARFAPDLALLKTLLPSSSRPQWAVLTAEALWCGYLGDARTVDYWRSALSSAGGAGGRPLEIVDGPMDELHARRADVWRVACTPGSMRASVPPSRIFDFVNQAALRGWAADAAHGIVITQVERDHWPAVDDAAKAVGGCVYFFDPRPVQLSVDPTRQQMVARLKEAMGMM